METILTGPNLARICAILAFTELGRHDVPAALAVVCVAKSPAMARRSTAKNGAKFLLLILGYPVRVLFCFGLLFFVFETLLEARPTKSGWIRARLRRGKRGAANWRYASMGRRNVLKRKVRFPYALVFSGIIFVQCNMLQSAHRLSVGFIGGKCDCF